MLYAVIAVSLFMIAIIILWRFDRAEIVELFNKTRGLAEDRFKEVYNVATRTNLTEEQVSTYLEELELYKNFAISIDAAVNAAVISLDTYKKQREYLFKQIDKLEGALHNE